MLGRTRVLSAVWNVDRSCCHPHPDVGKRGCVCRPSLVHLTPGAEIWKHCLYQQYKVIRLLLADLRDVLCANRVHECLRASQISEQCEATPVDQLLAA